MKTNQQVQVHRGLGCTAVVDPIERTVTLFHFGILTNRHKRRISPRVIALDDVTGITHLNGSFLKRGSMRLVLYNGAGYHPSILKDINSYFDVDGDTEGDKFARTVLSIIGR
ncbi:hypothetical protein [Rhodococcus sp. A14]|jgi:hypothetical protein|uniref:hypothetical protein n=1 Tax=Rhodococcus sp. A14 TaxID=1194106 RepID=UPI00142184F5|nr:hypothetical protein [Rhodococcus sp. A14]